MAKLNPVSKSDHLKRNGTGTRGDDRVDGLGREEKILTLKKSVCYWAGQFRKRYSTLEYGDLISVGWLGAIKAVDTYIGELSSLHGWAEIAIRRELFEFIRREGVVHKYAGVMPVKAKTGLDSATFPITFMSKARFTQEECERNNKLDARTVLDTAEMIDPRRARVLREYYISNRTLSDIGKTDSSPVNESRTSQLLHSGEAMVRAALA
jgi:RNA polymerase sigma factor (sigma-70 family)